MKKMYKEPKSEVANIPLQNILTGSFGKGPDTSSIPGDPIGD